jgi:hypothetical protein
VVTTSESSAAMKEAADTSASTQFFAIFSSRCVMSAPVSLEGGLRGRSHPKDEPGSEKDSGKKRFFRRILLPAGIVFNGQVAHARWRAPRKTGACK